MVGEELVGVLPRGWEYSTLGEECARAGGDVQTGPFGSQLHAADYVSRGIPSIMPQNIGDNRVVRDGIAQITVGDAERLKRYRLRPGDIVYSRRGDVERRALIRHAEDGWLCGTGCLRVRFGDGHVSPTYASYYLADRNVRDWIVRHAHGATMPNLNTGILSALPFVLPPLPEQRWIAQTVQAVLAKRAPGDSRPDEELDHAVRQIIARAMAPEGVVDIFAAAGLKKPDISILSDQFLAEVRGMPQRNLAVELLQKLLKGELRVRGRKNVVQARSFAEMLEQSVRRYQNRAIEAAQVIEELIALARQMREADRRGEDLGLSEDELAFYDALETNDSAVAVLGDKTLRGIARELVAAVRANVTIDWTLRETVRAQLRVIVKRILRKYGYPPDKQEKATQTVLEQAEVLSELWAA